MNTSNATIEQVVFLQGEEAEKALDILDQEGWICLYEYLEQWHRPGEHETTEKHSYGPDDLVSTFLIRGLGGYSISVNRSLRCVGMEFMPQDIS